ncbi:LysM peptidoglycan-binding domain-containing protein [Elioraea sp.]|uniref:LysM peptidoglycan-binding domain-containing protein n=1 Tax=Elioraea sp. TaxID=2185103 RepID=UPI0021DCD7C8|nr:LysM peptidoglycan-binding domain-containing protein [Elioraea sp.]GIX09982.1 MAG: hypothetical protein KatS3mg116_1692 [Elioraea sp.]
MRPYVVGLLGLLAILGAAWLALGERDRDLAGRFAALTSGAMPGAPAGAPPAPPAAAPETAPRVAPAPAAAPQPPGPSFDIVRVNARGDAVMAGRAAPHAEIVILDGTNEIGRVKADDRGEWVFVPAAPMPPGGHELSLRARNPDGTVRESASSVVLVVPERDRDVAGRPVTPGAAAPPIALLAPREEGGALQVLQAPPADPLPAASPAPVPPAAVPPWATPDAPPAATARMDPAPAPDMRPAPPAGPVPSVVAALPPAPVAPPAPAAPPEPPARPAAPAAPVGRPPTGVSVDAVDYGEDGGVSFAGRANPGDAVRLYLDGQHLGDARADAEGRWVLAPATPIAPGRTQALRADQVAPDGRVTARVELPFQRAETPPGGLRPGSIVVQPGHSLWRIARATYGRGIRYTVIYEANRAQIRDPDLIYPGQVFVLPPAGRDG